MEKIVMKISVVTVCYNSSKTIEQTILSVVNQSYENKEYIIIDGGSTDGTQSLIRKYENNIAYWVSEPDQGIYDAMNKGIKQCTGDIIAILNSDDWYEEEILSTIATYFTENDDIVVGTINQVVNDRVYKKRGDIVDQENIHLRMIYSHPAMIVRRAVYRNVGLYNVKYKISADYEWALRAHNAGVCIRCVPDVFVSFRMNGISTRQAYQCRIENREIALANMGEHNPQILKNKIEEYYEHILKQSRYNDFYQVVWRQELDFIKTLFDFSKDYYIWGTGYYGEMCYELFHELGIKIAGFIDNHIQQELLHNFVVVTPDKICEDNIICISTPKYESEIKEQLFRMHFAVERCICFSDIQSRIYEKLNRDKS